jgi:hypothetical protein
MIRNHTSVQPINNVNNYEGKENKLKNIGYRLLFFLKRKINSSATIIAGTTIVKYINKITQLSCC